MKMKKLWIKTICLFVFSIFSSCSLFADTAAPYQITGEMTLMPSSEYENAGFEFSFFNRSEKSVQNLTIVFFLFDEDGNTPLAGKNNVVLKINLDVEPLSSIDKVVSLDKFLTYVPEEPYEVDYLYVSSISYTDGSSWTDPLGFAVF